MLEEASELESRRGELQKLKDEAIGRKGRREGKKEDLEKQLEKAKNERLELENKSGQADLALQRLTLAQECARVLDELHEALADRTKQELSTRVNETFKSILQKDYWAEIDNDYCLQIYKEIPGHGPQIVYEKSTGESQVTSLSFIGSIVSLAKEQSVKKAQFFRGGVFPIIMDSPFGALAHCATIIGDWEKPSGESRLKTLQKFVAVHASIHSHFNQERHLICRQIFKKHRSAALAEWRQLVA